MIMCYMRVQDVVGHRTSYGELEFSFIFVALIWYKYIFDIPMKSDTIL